MRRLHATVEGHVQGVGYRRYVQMHAEHLGITGWVRNTADGRVEVTAEGENIDLDRLVLLLQKGPPHAYVDDVRATFERPTGEFVGFRVQ